jgi:hypothetical protein
MIRTLLLTFIASIASAVPLLEKVDVFPANTNGIARYRIPGIVVTPKGTVLAYSEARRTLATATGVDGLQGQLFAGLKALTASLLDRRWPREDGAQLAVERLLVDANYESNAVYEFCATSRHAAVITPSHGKYVGAGSNPFSEYKQRPGDRVGHDWRMPNVSGRRAARRTCLSPTRTTAGPTAGTRRRRRRRRHATTTRRWRCGWRRWTRW